jgi:hypothetical protein
MPKSAEVRRLLLVAEIGDAFDRKDYDTFLAKSKEIATQNPKEAQVAAGVASAYACKYAVTGEESFRQEALRQLEKAAALAPPGDKDYPEYANRIRHRIETREIIKREEFRRRFPNGWKPEAAPSAEPKKDAPKVVPKEEAPR